MSIRPQPIPVSSVNQQLTFSVVRGPHHPEEDRGIVADRQSICQQLVSYAAQIRKCLDYFLGSGLALDNHLKAPALVPEEIVI
jgi:hypothetical protein